MPKRLIRKFRDDVVRVARNREPSDQLKQLAADSGISESWLASWMQAADVEYGTKVNDGRAVDRGGPHGRSVRRTGGDTFGKSKNVKAKGPGPPVHDDLCAIVDEHSVKRHRFDAEQPIQLWVGDITED